MGVTGEDLPYPASPVIAGLSIDPARTSIGTGDNWPVTWADDGDLYTVYDDGEGWGKRRYSLGLAKITGSPPEIAGENIPSPTGERGPDDTGYGKNGLKACGMLMVDGVLYMWVRNHKTDGTGSVLAWSDDHARTWTWAEWDFPEIGYPVWLNFGRNYDGARDEFLYFYSTDSPSAYDVTEEILLARVARARAREKDAYEFFAGLDATGKPTWSRDFAAHKAVCRNPGTFRSGGFSSSGTGRCYRPGVAYLAGIRRYLLCTTITAYFAVFDAPEPWGPWTTVYSTEEFGPTETRFQPHIPSKWIADDGQTFYLLYSCHPKGPYQFNIQKCTLTLR